MKNKKCWYKNVCKQKCTSGCVRYNSMQSLLEKSNIPEYMWNVKPLYAYDKDISSFEKLAQIKSNIIDFVNTGQNLYIYSDNCGNGKTSWSVKLMLSYFDKVWDQSGFSCKGVFVNVPTFLYQHKQNISYPTNNFNTLLNNVQNARLVIWDDIASTKLSEYDHQLLLTYIDSRINRNYANIFTGNCNRDKCIGMVGNRLTSRIFNNISVSFEERDKRGLKIDG